MFGTANGGNANGQNNGVDAGTIIHGTSNPGCTVVTYTMFAVVPISTLLLNKGAEANSFSS